METKTRQEKELVWAQILYLYIAPVLLLYYHIIPGNLRILMLFGITLILLGIIKNARWTYKDMGIFKGWLKDWKIYSVFTVIGVAFLFYFGNFFERQPIENWWLNTKFLLLFIPLSVVQEVVFRGILMNMLKRAFEKPFFMIALNASLFALIHIIYLHAAFILPVTFIGGIGFAWIYYARPNLILISISHIILNFFAMILGYFVLR